MFFTACYILAIWGHVSIVMVPTEKGIPWYDADILWVLAAMSLLAAALVFVFDMFKKRRRRD